MGVSVLVALSAKTGVPLAVTEAAKPMMAAAIELPFIAKFKVPESKQTRKKSTKVKERVCVCK